eukprot:Platyproteum_vivax@DN7592_c1_g1_i2.p1
MAALNEIVDGTDSVDLLPIINNADPTEYGDRLTAGARAIFGPKLTEGHEMRTIIGNLQLIPRENVLERLRSIDMLPEEDSNVAQLKFEGPRRKKCRRCCCCPNGTLLFLVFFMVFFFPSSMYGIVYEGLMFLGISTYFERGGNLGIMLCTGFLFFCMSKGFYTLLRKANCCMRFKVFQAMVNEHRFLHTFACCALAGFTMLHTLAQFFGVLNDIAGRILQRVRGFDNIKRDLPPHYWPLEGPYNGDDNYWAKYRILMSLTPQISGMVLIGVFIAGLIVTLKPVRTKLYELFCYGYPSLLVVWFGIMIWHGSRGWFNYGYVMSPFIVGPGFVFWICDLIGRAIAGYRKGTYGDYGIISAEVSENAKAGKITVSLPKGFTYRTGQIVYLSCPAVSSLQWHPFAIGSSERNMQLSFMIGAVEGGWTKTFLKNVQKCALEGTPFPKIRIDGPYGAAAEESRFKRKLMFVGEGSGICSFLGFLDNKIKDFPVQNKLSGTYSNEESQVALFQRAHFFWICENLEQLVWFQTYLVDLILAPEEASQYVHVDLYVPPNVEKSADSLMFLLALQDWLQTWQAAVSIHFYRPSWHSTIKQTMFEGHHEDTEPEGWKIYVCGPPLLTTPLKKAGSKIFKEGGDLTVYEEKY